jgi:HEPN pEK499 p136
MSDYDELSEPIQLASRSDSHGFAQRTLKNLEYIEKRRQADDDVHVVTQRVLSLLGLVAYPWEEGLDEYIRTADLDMLVQNGWPRWDITLGKEDTKTPGELAYHLRNAVAHRRVYFFSDSREGRDVEIKFEDAKKKNNVWTVYWRAQINADDLLSFCRKFARRMEDEAG